MVTLVEVQATWAEHIRRHGGGEIAVRRTEAQTQGHGVPFEHLRVRMQGNELQACFTERSHEFETVTEDTLQRHHMALALMQPTLRKHLFPAGFTTRVARWLGIHALTQWLTTPVPQTPEGVVVATPQPFTWKTLLAAPFAAVNEALKWGTRKLLFDNFISKYLIGSLVAFIANRGNPHYHTPARKLSKTLGNLVYPGGTQKPVVNADGSIDLGPVLSVHYSRRAVFDANGGNFDAQPYRVQSKPGVVLDGIQTSNGVHSDSPLYIVFFLGNTGCYETSHQTVTVPHLQQFAQADIPVPVTAIEFNYPGVLNSTGKVRRAQDLFDAGISVVQSLLDKNIPADRIGLHGVSLGGSIASHVASHFESRGFPLAGTYVSKTFSSTTNVAISYLQRVPYIGGLIGMLVRPIVAFALWSTRWQMDTAAQFTSLTHADYSVVRSPKAARNGETPPLDDPVLSHYASLHESWRLRLRRFFHKHGWLKYKGKADTYASDNCERKMQVYSFNEAEAVLELAPDICGHSREHFEGIVLQHRTPEGSAPLTSSGRIQRFFRECSDLRDASEMGAAATSSPSSSSSSSSS